MDRKLIPWSVEAGVKLGVWGQAPFLPTTRAKHTVIGNSLETGRTITVEDEGRCGGVYILGQPRTGKSTLLVSMALGDIENNHGLIFIDPHGDAITDLMSRIPDGREKDVILLDPTDEKYSFGINLLQCSDPTDEKKLDETYGRVRDIFAKVWGDKDGELGLWFERVLRGAVLLLLENSGSGYTLVDLPLVLREDTTFRNHLLKNSPVKWGIKDYWYDEFNRLPRREQTEQVGTILNRIGILRDNQALRHIVGQSETTINLREIINSENSQKIILLRIPASSPNEKVREFIGTLVVSEVLNAALNRYKLRKEDRRFFGVYCDEFHNFATQEFAKLFTETGKYKIMPVVAHHERTGQFKTNASNLGATSAAPNKVFFRLSPDDAKNFAVEFAKPPPTETRREREIVISKKPIAILLVGHNHPEICAFVDQYLRVMQERREDTKEDIERIRVERSDDMDDAALYRIDAAMEALGDRASPNYHAQRAALENAQASIGRAQAKTARLLSLFERSNEFRLTFRALNKFFTSVMKGNIAPGQESFSGFLVDIVHNYSRVPAKYLRTLELYIAVSYGDGKTEREVPFALAKTLAKTHGRISACVAIITYVVDAKTKKARAEFRSGYLKQHLGWFDYEQGKGHIQWQAKMLPHRNTREWYYRNEFDYVKNLGQFLWRGPNVYENYVWLRAYSELWDMLAPYRNAKFAPEWKQLLTNLNQLICETYWSDISIRRKGLFGITNTCAVGMLRYEVKTIEALIALVSDSLDCGRFHDLSAPAADNVVFYSKPYLSHGVIKSLKAFLKQYQEGAFVMLALVDVACRGGFRQADNKGMLRFPGVEGVDALEVLRVVKKLNDFMLRNRNMHLFAGWFNQESVKTKNTKPWTFFEKGKADGQEIDDFMWRLKGDTGIDFRIDELEIEAEQFLEKTLKERWVYFCIRFGDAAGQWSRTDDLTRKYLLSRAVHLVYHGKDIAALAYPQPSFPGAQEMVEALVRLLQDTESSLVKTEEEKQAARERGERRKKEEEIEKECAKEMAKVVHSPPETLGAAELSADEVKRVKDACYDELGKAGREVRETRDAIDHLVAFCTLLSRPENHVQVACGQYVERQVYTRHHNDMADEMEQKLMRSDPGEAYAKVIHEQNGKRQVLTEKIQTLLLPAGLPELDARDRNTRIERNSQEFCKPRDQIEQEIRQRQERWRGARLDKPPPRVAGRGDEAKVEKPPPSRY